MGYASPDDERRAKPELVAGRYEIIGLIGSGGMGTVYRARDSVLDETVALKTLRRDYLEDADMLERFRREVKLARRVTHGNVARVFDIGEHAGELFLTMEFVDGESLGDRIGRRGRFPLAEVAEIACAMCAGLAAAHAAGVVHRDLKPDNVLVAKDGRVVVTDFGIARAHTLKSTQTMAGPVGTPAYMAPEQVENAQDIDSRADIYGVGTVLYELLTGERPWKGDAPLAVAAAKLTRPPPDPRDLRPDLPQAWARVVMRCMARLREDRFAAVEEVAHALTDLTLPRLDLDVAAPAMVRSLYPPPVGSATAVGGKTVAVIPFRNAGPPEDAYLAEGLTDDLIDVLSMTRGLRVRPRGAAMRFKEDQRDPREIGRDLDVQVVVEGSVRRLPGAVLIKARLISVADGYQLWAKRFQHADRDLLAINDEAARAVAEALTLEPTAEPRNVPSDPAAIELYLRGRSEYRTWRRDGVERGIELFNKALAISPDDPMILAGLAIALARLAFLSGQGVAEAIEVAERAVRAGPELAEAHVALGSAKLQSGDFEECARQSRLALQRMPALADANALFGRLAVEAGLIDEGLKRLEWAVMLDADLPLARREISRVLALVGRWDEAFEALRLSEMTEPNIYWASLVRMLLWRRDAAGAIEILKGFPPTSAFAISPRPVLELIAHGKSPYDNPQFQAISERARTGGPRARAFFGQLETEILGYVGDAEHATEALAMAVDGGLVDVVWLDLCPILECVRAHPRYAALRHEVGLRAARLVAALTGPLEVGGPKA